MSTASLTWKCPGCGAIVAFPADLGPAGGPAGGRHLDQLAQALCGCWVAKLPDKGLARLLRAVIIGDEGYYDGLPLEVAGSC
jgi:hypothetical protein